jgi:hypothetical protein
MTTRERFTDEEWSLVRHLPFDAFVAGALSEGISQEELAAFVGTLERALGLKDPLHREILIDWATGDQERVMEELRFELEESGSQMHNRFERTKPILHAKLTDDEYQSFVISVTMSALAVAAASTKKRGLFGKKKELISDQEAHALTGFAMLWDVDPRLFAERLAEATS